MVSVMLKMYNTIVKESETIIILLNSGLRTNFPYYFLIFLEFHVKFLRECDFAVSLSFIVIK